VVLGGNNFGAVGAGALGVGCCNCSENYLVLKIVLGPAVAGLGEIGLEIARRAAGVNWKAQTTTQSWRSEGRPSYRE